MVAHKNFYETIQEARMRLRNTIVKYKDDFYYVIEVGDHMPDGKFRVYMDQLGHNCVGRERHPSFPKTSPYSIGDSLVLFDKFIEEHPDSGFIRKYADSRHFEKFRPFPLGCVNVNGSVTYTERTPTRNMHQGLLQDAIFSTNVESVPTRYDPNAARTFRGGIDKLPLGDGRTESLSPEFYNMLLGLYPTYEQVVTNLRDPSVMNNGCAFHREYSIMRGPLDTLMLCYKHNGVGIIDPDESVTIGSTHEFLLEEMEELGVFNKITVKEISGE